jgi:hypothetical protein
LEGGQPVNTGATLYGAAGTIVDLNVPGCIALADPSNGPACARAFEPLMQCVDAACALWCSASDFGTCAVAATGTGAPCASYYAAITTPCATDLATNGVAYTVCGWNSNSELTDVLNVICGTGQ